jgi:hypothetical protein
MFIDKSFFRFIENASVAELITHKGKFQLFLQKIENCGSPDYAGEAKAAIRIIDEEMAARCEVDELLRRRKNA